MARLLGEKLRLPKAIVEALELAGQWHDRGKNRVWWQRAVGNTNFERPLAKTGHARFNTIVNGGYRHEFGSLLEMAPDELPGDELQRNLALHLIAAHHGWGRPHFPERAYDRTYGLARNREVAQEVIGRFARLQKRFGWWGLAYLEAVFKAADGIASSGAVDGRTP